SISQGAGGGGWVSDSYGRAAWRVIIRRQGGDCLTSVLMDDPGDHPSLGVSPPPDNGQSRGESRQRLDREPSVSTQPPSPAPVYIPARMPPQHCTGQKSQFTYTSAFVYAE